jgi:cytochrome c oxidase assembly factor 4
MAMHKEKFEHLSEEEKDAYEIALEKSGCAKHHFVLQDCYFEHKDWRKCQQEMAELKKCTDEQSKLKETARQASSNPKK